jgi:RNA polymerase sigma factor (sigma-70 family)
MTEAPDEPCGGVDRPQLDGPRPAEIFAVLFDRHARPLHRYLARRVGGDIANDLVSETFLVALNHRHRYDPALATARAWLFGIATNLLRTHVRSEVRGLRATARAAAAADSPGHDTAVADRVDAQARVRRLAAALAELSTSDRDVLLLTSWAGFDSTEVAAALDIPVGTVRSRLHRVRRKLRAVDPHRTHDTTDGGSDD